MSSTTPAPETTDNGGDVWVTSVSAWAVAGVCAWSSIIITCWQIYQHLKTYTRPVHQRWIVRILFMVPIYAFCSWLSLKYYDQTKITLYFDTIRNMYEAFVIYVFVSLCFEYLGGEAAILAALNGRMNVPMWLTCTCCMKPFPYGLQFLRFIKQGCLQFCVVKPVMAVVTIAAVATDNYTDGDFNPAGVYFWVALVYNTSIGVALSALLLFYAATRDLLAPYRPVLKFFIVKAVIFFAFWQGFGLMIAQNIGIITDHGDVEAGQIAMAYQNFIICMEMVMASVGLLYGFPHSDYKIGGPQAGSPEVLKGVASNLKNTLNPKDVIDDTIRNFSSTYKKYARAHMDNEDVVDVADTDPDTDDDMDRSAQGYKGKGKRLKKKRYSRLSLPEMENEDEPDSLA
eukprot:m.174807 g.174807  ORF g.174807 m.174807 type:complete len:399 (+) comp13876_c0_seq1:96-1292(+)